MREKSLTCHKIEINWFHLILSIKCCVIGTHCGEYKEKLRRQQHNFITKRTFCWSCDNLRLELNHISAHLNGVLITCKLIAKSSHFFSCSAVDSNFHFSQKNLNAIQVRLFLSKVFICQAQCQVRSSTKRHYQSFIIVTYLEEKNYFSVVAHSTQKSFFFLLRVVTTFSAQKSLIICDVFGSFYKF